MEKGRHKHKKGSRFRENSLQRIVLAALAVLLQIGWLLFAVIKLNSHFVEIETVIRVIALITALLILGNRTNTTFKESWLFLILAAPVFGMTIYFLFGNSFPLNRERKIYNKLNYAVSKHMPNNDGVLERLKEQDDNWSSQADYLSNYMGFPIYDDSEITFFGDTNEALEAQLAAIKSAKEYIFMEYFAVEDAEAFSRMKELLIEKAAEGVNVRIMYDDVGSVGFVNPKFGRELEGKGIECRIFNRIIPFVKLFLNNRDHRKLMIVDGEIAFTGGYNIADEYFNITHPYGVWKDSGVRIRGNAVISVTGMFLEMWNSISPTDKDYGVYMKPAKTAVAGVPGNVFVQPFCDTPLDDEYVGENVYLNMIALARESLYISTPYVAVTEEMVRQLGLAARRGVDVRMVIPGIPDKKIVYELTKSYAPKLLENGVRIYCYTPGFNHAKQFCADGKAAVVGTINMDFRSFCHHFEDGVFWYGGDAVEQVSRDFEEMFAVSDELTPDSKVGRMRRLGIWQSLLRLLAPLL